MPSRVIRIPRLCAASGRRHRPHQRQPPGATHNPALFIGSAVSPVLANLFMHYAFDSWLGREFPAVDFERFADDAVVHCATERQALQVRAALSERLASVGLRLHPDKTRVVYCKDRKRRLEYECTSFTFLGYTYRARKAPTERREEHVRCVPPGDQRGRPER